jgi:transketolase
MDAFSLRKFKEDFPDRFINIGVAEQNMMSVAAGLASCGKRVFTYGINTFVSMRCFEQIKINLCSTNLPVTIIGAGAGFSFGFDGPTHHGTQDLAVMRALPELTIYNPSDSASAAGIAHAAYASKGPTYIRLDKGKFPSFYDAGENLSAGFKILKPLTDVNILATGYMTGQAMAAAKELELQGRRVGVVDVYRVKPLPQALLEVADKSKRLFIVEENCAAGGFGSAVMKLLQDHGKNTSVKRLAIPDKQFLSYGDRDWFHKTNQLDVASLVKEIR